MSGVVLLVNQNRELEVIPWATWCPDGDTLAALQRSVGGNIELVRVGPTADVYGHDEAMLRWMDLEGTPEQDAWDPRVRWTWTQPAGGWDVIFGPLVLVGRTPEGDTRGLLPDDLRRIMLVHDPDHRIPYLNLDVQVPTSTPSEVA